MKIIHKVKKNEFKCDNCDKIYGYKYQLKRHFDSVHEGWKYYCNLCGKSFSYEENLQKHRNEHRGITFKCKACPKVYTIKQSLSYHIKKTHPELRKSSNLSNSQKSQEANTKDCDSPMKRGSWIVKLERIDTSKHE